MIVLTWAKTSEMCTLRAAAASGRAFVRLHVEPALFEPKTLVSSSCSHAHLGSPTESKKRFERV